MSWEDEDLVRKLGRTTLCLGSSESGTIIQKGDHGFMEALQQYYSGSESDALERLAQLKKKLRKASKSDFWSLLIHGMTAITSSQYGFVSKRVQGVGESVSQAPLPGEPGSCLLAVVFYWNDGGELHNLKRDYKYWASGAPCDGMKHDKVFLVPNGLPQFFPNNPNPLPFPAEAYMGIPMFTEGRCFGHFGSMFHFMSPTPFLKTSFLTSSSLKHG